MKYIKTPVYEFSELDEDTKQKVIDKERTFYFDCMFEDDLNLWLFDSDTCPLINSGVSIDSLKDLSYDLSNYLYDHVTFRECTFSKDILEKSGALDLIRAKLEHTPLDVNTFLSNLDISWRLPNARDYFCTSGEVVVDGIDYWDDITDEHELAEDLAETVAECLTEYMHNLQRKLYDYLIELTDDMSLDETIIKNLDPDMVYDQDGTCYSVDEVEEE